MPLDDSLEAVLCSFITKPALQKSDRIFPIQQCCGSGMFIPDPNFFPSRIPDPGSKRFRIPDPYPLQRIQVFLNQKIVSKLSELWSGMFIPDPDPGFGSWFFIHPGSRDQKGTRSRVRNTAIQDFLWITAIENIQIWKPLEVLKSVLWT